MNDRSPSVKRICAAAVLHFAERGYHAASLNEIAEAVGIRKASLYAHFTSKDALYRQVFEDALQYELIYLNQCFADELASEQAGMHYCSGLAQRYQTSEHLRFLLRSAYFPPASLQQPIGAGFERYLQVLQQLFVSKLAADLAKQEWLSQTYLAMVDSLHVELIYAGGQRFTQRLAAMQQMLALALTR